MKLFDSTKKHVQYGVKYFAHSKSGGRLDMQALKEKKVCQSDVVSLFLYPKNDVKRIQKRSCEMVFLAPKRSTWLVNLCNCHTLSSKILYYSIRKHITTMWDCSYHIIKIRAYKS